MNRARKNIVVVGFDNIEKNSLGLPNIDKGIIHYVDTLKEAIKYQGYLLIYDNSRGDDLIEIDKKYRNSLLNFDKIWIYNKKYKNRYDKWSRFYYVNRDIFLDISFSMLEEWEEYKNIKNSNLEDKMSKKKEEYINYLYHYFKNIDGGKTKDLIKGLDVSGRSFERFMFDMNKMFHNVGYDYKKNEWYFIY